MNETSPIEDVSAVSVMASASNANQLQPGGGCVSMPTVPPGAGKPCSLAQDRAVQSEIHLEPLTVHHAPAVYRHATPEVMALTRRPNPSRPQDTVRWIEALHRQPHHRGFAISHYDIGFMGVIHLTTNSESGSFYIWLGNAFWGKGYGTEAIRHFLGIAFEDLQLVELFTSALKHNTRSIRLLETADFQHLPHHNGRLRFYRSGLKRIAAGTAIDRFRGLLTACS